MQREEWKQELLSRALNFIACHGTIPPDELATMKAHPDYKSAIFPVICQSFAMVERATEAAKPALLSAPRTPVQ